MHYPVSHLLAARRNYWRSTSCSRGHARGAVVSRDVHLVARLFPALLQVPAIALSEHKGIEITDSQEFRKRAFISLLDLLGRFASRTPLVIALDDLQWGDLDSAIFFREFASSISPASLL